MKYITLPILAIVLAHTVDAQVAGGRRKFATPQIPFAPRHYVCYRASAPVHVDGKLDEQSWKKAQWTDTFVDIEGDLKPFPLQTTKAKMLWDDNFLYVGAEIHETNLWATLRQRDTVIYRDNDFEVFIDPNGATQPYYETEINALGTVWDLLLRAPYRDVGKAAINAWDIKGLKVGVSLQGTLNNPADVDTGWTAEIAFPWNVLGEAAFSGAPPQDGTQWRVNFSRVEWRTKIEHGTYIKETDPKTGESLPECNWVWSPQGLINMHYPEMWGFVQFSTTNAGEGNVDFVWNPVETLKWNLRLVYYAERQYLIDHGSFSDDLTNLDVRLLSPAESSLRPRITVTPNMFESIISTADGKTNVHIAQDGRTWITKTP
jgi:hypothetical protein